MNELMSDIMMYIDEFTIDEMIYLLQSIRVCGVLNYELVPYIERNIVKNLNWMTPEDLDFLISTLACSRLPIRNKFWLTILEDVQSNFEKFSGDSITRIYLAFTSVGLGELPLIQKIVEEFATSELAGTISLSQKISMVMEISTPGKYIPHQDKAISKIVDSIIALGKESGRINNHLEQSTSKIERCRLLALVSTKRFEALVGPVVFDEIRKPLVAILGDITYASYDEVINILTILDDEWESEAYQKQEYIDRFSNCLDLIVNILGDDISIMSKGNIKRMSAYLFHKLCDDKYSRIASQYE